MRQPPADQSKVALGVLLGIGIAALPFASARIRQREHAVHNTRDEAYDAAGDEARASRLSRKR
jgi:hypothetical protein